MRLWRMTSDLGEFLSMQVLTRRYTFHCCCTKVTGQPSRIGIGCARQAIRCLVLVAYAGSVINTISQVISRHATGSPAKPQRCQRRAVWSSITVLRGHIGYRSAFTLTLKPCSPSASPAVIRRVRSNKPYTKHAHSRFSWWHPRNST